MTDRIRIKMTWVAAVYAACVCTVSAAAAEKPNVVFVMLDDLGFSQIEAFGRGLTPADCDPKLLAHVAEKADYTLEEALRLMKKASPTLSRMADGGVKFNNAFACSNLCAPSRIGVATGVLQNRWGIYRNIDTEAHGLKPNSHLAEKLQEQGYATAHIGKWHVGSRDEAMVQRYLEKHKVPDPGKYTYWTLGKKYRSIQQELKRDGYEGSVIPKDHPLHNGFNYYFGYNQWECPFYKASNVWEDFKPAGIIKDYNTDVFTDKALAFMEKSLEEKKPFYVQLHYHAVHSPLDPKAPNIYSSRFDSGSKLLNNFYAHIFGVDENVRKIFEWLEEKGVAENTLLVFTSDNGGAVGGKSCLPGNAPYRGHKGMLNLGGFRVPLFFYWPAGIKTPGANEQLVSTLDILPTIIDAAGGDVPGEIDGKSLLPQMLENSDSRVRDHLAIGGIHARVWAFNGATSFFEHNVSREKAPSGYIVADERYVLRFVSETIPDLYKDAVAGLPARYALYDYRTDPGERNNLIHSMPEKAEQLKAVWKRESTAYPEPVEWDVSKWEAIINP